MEMASNKPNKKVEYDFAVLDLAEVFGWSYQEIMNTPDWFIHLALWKLNIDNKTKNAKNWN